MLVYGKLPMKQQVLFVCIENACRSQMAEALTRLYASDVIEAASAGSRPSGLVNPLAVEVIRELDYDLGQHRSKSLDEMRGREFDYVITMGCGDECPFIPARQHLDWDIPDPKGGTLEMFRQARDLIETKVKDLIQRVRTDHANSQSNSS
jgi:protein-tyrosine-phosphatase